MSKELNNRKIQLVSSALSILMILALFRMPYGYYSFLRFSVLIGACIVIYNFYQKDGMDNSLIWGYILVLILWNPIAPIYMDRSVWIIFDFVAAIFFGYNVYKVR